MDNRAARRRAAATSRRVKDRSQKMPAVEPRSTTERVGQGRPRESTQSRCKDLEPAALVVSHCFDSGEVGEPYSATVRLTGRRVGVHGVRNTEDEFVQEDKVGRVVPGSGRVSITSRVYGLEPGEWNVRAELLRAHGDGRRGLTTVEPIGPASWSLRRWAVSSGASGLVKTRWAILAPLAQIPGVIPGTWPALGALAVLVALGTQAAVLAHKNVAFGQPQVVFLIALASGMIAAELWYAALHPGPFRQRFSGAGRSTASSRWHPWSRSRCCSSSDSRSARFSMPPRRACSSASRSAASVVSSPVAVRAASVGHDGACGPRIAGSVLAGFPLSSWSRRRAWRSLSQRPC